VSQSRRLKAIVLGAGPVGSALATGLHHAGMDVALYERGEAFDARSSGVVMLSGAGLVALRVLGLHDAVAAAGVTEKPATGVIWLGTDGGSPAVDLGKLGRKCVSVTWEQP
jgi:2-polyprenyl-6-methoxyphenol hydroxylase-like FAD-dependent oxidoreductase